MKKEAVSRNSKNKKFGSIRLGFMSGIGLVVFLFIMTVISGMLSTTMIVPWGLTLFENLIITILTVLFGFGFYGLGKKYDSTFLKVISILVILFVIVSFLAVIFVLSPIMTNVMTSVTSIASNMNINPQNITSEQQQAFMTALFSDSTLVAYVGAMVILFLIYVIIAAILSILLGIALIRIRKNVKYAKTAGILEIVGGATAIIIVGFVVMLVAFVYELIILKRESKN